MPNNPRASKGLTGRASCKANDYGFFESFLPFCFLRSDVYDMDKACYKGVHTAPPSVCVT